MVPLTSHVHFEQDKPDKPKTTPEDKTDKPKTTAEQKPDKPNPTPTQPKKSTSRAEDFRRKFKENLNAAKKAEQRRSA